MEGLECNDFRCIYYKKKKGCTATKVFFLDHKCATRCCKDAINNLMTKFKGGRKD